MDKINKFATFNVMNSRTLRIRLKSHEYELIELHAKKAKMSLINYLRDRLNLPASTRGRPPGGFLVEFSVAKNNLRPS